MEYHGVTFLELPRILHLLSSILKIRFPMNSDPIVRLAKSAPTFFQMMPLDINFSHCTICISLSVVIMVVRMIVDAVIYAWSVIFIISIYFSVSIHSFVS